MGEDLPPPGMSEGEDPPPPGMSAEKDPPPPNMSEGKSEKHIDKFFSNCYILHIRWGIEEDSGGEVPQMDSVAVYPLFYFPGVPRSHRPFRIANKNFTVD